MNKTKNINKILKTALLSFLVVLALIAGWNILYEKKSFKQSSIFLYYTDKSYKYLIPDLQTIRFRNTEAQERTGAELTPILYKLFYPSKAELKSALPSTLKFIEVKVEDSVAILKIGFTNKGIGTAEESLMVGAIVNTLTELPYIKKVKINVTGKEALHLDYSSYLQRADWINLVKS